MRRDTEVCAMPVIQWMGEFRGEEMIVAAFNERIQRDAVWMLMTAHSDVHAFRHILLTTFPFLLSCSVRFL